MFPAHAGVILALDIALTAVVCVPRACGGDPKGHNKECEIISVFPAHAGVIRSLERIERFRDSVPRACGGDPKDGSKDYVDNECSPRMRG